MYDMVQEQIATYEQKLQEELQQQACQALQDEDCPRHPNPAKEKAIRARGEQQARTTLYRYAAVDLTRIDGISAGAARTILTEIGPDLSAFPDREALRELAGPGTPPRGVGREDTAGEEARKGHGSHTRLERPAHGRDLADPFQVRAGRRAAPQGAAQGDADSDLRHRAQAGYAGLPHAALGSGLRRRGEAAYEERHRQRTLTYLKTTAKDLGYQLVPNTAPPATPDTASALAA